MKTTLLTPSALKCLIYAANSLPRNSVVMCAGVYRGGDVAAMGAMRPDLLFICLDSFEGLGEPSDLDGDSKPGQFAATIREFIETTRGLKVLPHQLWITKETLRELFTNPVSRPSMMWLDLDHHAPTRAMLAHFLPMMAADSIVLTHDYGSANYPGIKKACDDFGTWEIQVNSIAKLTRRIKENEQV